METNKVYEATLVAQNIKPTVAVRYYDIPKLGKFFKQVLELSGYSKITARTTINYEEDGLDLVNIPRNVVFSRVGRGSRLELEVVGR